MNDISKSNKEKYFNNYNKVTHINFSNLNSSNYVQTIQLDNKKIDSKILPPIGILDNKFAEYYDEYII